ncbi:MAG TPA: ATP-binding cassette domain-containing protein [Actinomycetota bacterium]|nr:ATP-binding cassette domain-containing protein [Actinomycetota bacterium]
MTKPAILVEGLTKNYGEVEALKGVDFEVPTGTIFGLLGPNGAGKTTAVRILSTILKPSGGRAEIFGYDVVQRPHDVRMMIGLAGQSAAVDPNLTGRENLKLIGTLAQLPGKAIAPRAAELLERFQLIEAGDRPIRTYSGGMRRRLDVAAALVGKPPVIFLDEPTTGLDIQSRTELWSVIDELVAEGSTVLLTTQYLEEADVLADRIAVVHGGVVVANDTASALKARLGNSVIEITLTDDIAARRAQSLLARLVTEQPEREGHRVHLSTAQAPKVLTEVLRSLDANGMTAVGITVREPSLDDVFLALTGHHVEEKKNGNGAGGKPAKGRKARRKTAPIDEAAKKVDEWIGGIEQGVVPPVLDVAAFDERWSADDEAGEDEDSGDGWTPYVEPAGTYAGGASKRLQDLLSQLPYKAGSGSVEANLQEVAEAALNYYRDASSNEPLDLQPVAGYLTLEKRFGRINDSTPAEQAASLLMGAAVARAVGLGAAPVNGEATEFARGAVKILLEGIGETV